MSCSYTNRSTAKNLGYKYAGHKCKEQLTVAVCDSRQEKQLLNNFSLAFKNGNKTEIVPYSTLEYLFPNQGI